MNIKVRCESDQGLLGVVRIATIEIELPDGSKNDDLSKNVFNTLAEREYFTEEDDWEIIVKKDVAYEVGCDLTDVEII